MSDIYICILFPCYSFALVMKNKINIKKNNYVSALKFSFETYTWSLQVFESHLIRRLLRGIKSLVHKQPTPKGVFSLEQIREICRLCNQFDNPVTYRAAFLLGFYEFLRISTSRCTLKFKMGQEHTSSRQSPYY